jgi:hypothetical protein
MSMRTLGIIANTLDIIWPSLIALGFMMGLCGAFDSCLPPFK